MGKFVAGQTLKCMVRQGRPINGANVIVLGLAFKEKCPGLRKSKVVDIVRELEASREAAMRKYGQRRLVFSSA